MKSSILFDVLFPLLLPLFWQIRADLSPDQMNALKNAYCGPTTDLQITASNDDNSETLVFFSHDNTTYFAKGKYRRAKPIDVAIYQQSGDLPTTASSTYLFLDTLNGYVLKKGDPWRFIGYNLDWIGCPQIPCLDGSMDAAFEKDDDLYFTSGAFFWRKKKEQRKPLRDKGQEIAGKQYLDAAFCVTSVCFLVKGNSPYMVDGFDNLETSDEAEIYLDKTCASDETRATVTTNMMIAIFLEKSYCSRIYLSTKVSAVSADLPPEWHDLDAVFRRDDELFLIKRWTYYKVKFTESANDLTLTQGEAAPSSVFTGLFGCNDNFYEELNMGSKDEYFEKMSKLVVGLSEEEWKEYLKSNRSGQSQTGAVNTTLDGETGLTLITAIVVAVVVLILGVAAVAAFILVRKKSRKVKKNAKKAEKRKNATANVNSLTDAQALKSNVSSKLNCNVDSSKKETTESQIAPPPATKKASSKSKASSSQKL